MELQKAIEILEYHQEWRFGKHTNMIYEPKKLLEALDTVIIEIKKFRLVTINDSLRELADEYERNALDRYRTGDHALSHIHMAAQARNGFEDGWKSLMSCLQIERITTN